MEKEIMLVHNMKSRALRNLSLVAAPVALTLLGTGSAAAQNIADFSLGGHNICIVDTEGQLECTTRFDPNTFLPPEDGTLYSTVSSGSAHSCAITQSGEMRCWGENSFGQLDSPSLDVAFISVDSGEGHSCAVDANTQVHCWGLNTNGQNNVPEPNSGFTSVHVGAAASCGIKQTGETVCWTTIESFGRDLPIEGGYTDLNVAGSSGGDPSCGLTQSGAIDCFFSNDFALQPPNNEPYIDVIGNGLFLCGLTADGLVDCEVREDVNESNRNLANAIGLLPPLTRVELSANSFPSASICGLTRDGGLSCAGDDLPALTVPRAENQSNPLPAVTRLQFSAYSDTSGELTWSPIPQRVFERIFDGHNIYRDGQFVAFTTNQTSFIIDDLVADQTFEFEIAVVGVDGVEGERAAVSVTTGNRNEPSQSNTPSASESFTSQPTNFIISRYSDNSLEVFWDAPSNLFNPSYQVFRNGEFIANVPGASYFDPNVNPDTDYTYTIFVLSRTGSGVRGVGFAFEPSL